MKTVIVTGSAGLIGSEASQFFADRGFRVLGVDNDMRKHFFGATSSTAWRRRQLEQSAAEYVHQSIDVRDADEINRLFGEYNTDISLVIHAAAQPSHDWAAKDPATDFTVNANGTLNLLEACRRHCPEAAFIFTSTNKVYGDNPNRLPLVEQETRWELDPSHPFTEHGIDETMSVDQTKHSLFGVSKLAADALVQEYGRYFGMKTACFRAGCLTGPGHSPAQLHGFLAYLVHCAIEDRPYTIIGYRGKQVRDNIHAADLIRAFWAYYQQPTCGEVYNIGGGRHSNCSVLEAIAMCERLTDRAMTVSFEEKPRSGDHVWYISDTRKFQSHYPSWRCSYDLTEIVQEIWRDQMARWKSQFRGDRGFPSVNRQP